jgi:hypothetical protein
VKDDSVVQLCGTTWRASRPCSLSLCRAQQRHSRAPYVPSRRPHRRSENERVLCSLRLTAYRHYPLDPPFPLSTKARTCAVVDVNRQRTCEGEKAGSPSARGMLPSRWVRHPLRSTPESSGCIYPLFLVLDACYGYIGQQGSKIRRWPNLLIFSLIFDEFDQTLIEPCGRILPDFEISDMPRCSLLHI